MKRSLDKENGESSSASQAKRKFIHEKPDIKLKNPGEIRIVDFAECRALEVEALSRAVSKMHSSKTICQRLPRHMRRRAMAHDVKRLPRRLREIALSKMIKSTKTNPNKRPSRKFRRRPKNLLEDYNRRQKRCCWLETHIWHAKRFHMTEKWGYKLALSPCDKSARACYRAASNHCLLQDISYVCCLEIQGPENKIIESLQHLTRPEMGPTIAAKAYLDGRRCGKTIFFSYNKNSNKPVAQISFMWRPHASSSNSVQGRQLWIWCHPSCFEGVLREVQKCIKERHATSLSVEKKQESKVLIKKNEIENSENKTTAEDRAMTIEGDSSKEMIINIECSDQFDKNSNFTTFSQTTGDVTVRSLKDKLVRFTLTGPLSQKILNETLQPSKIDTAETSMSGDSDNHSLWWEKYFSDDNMKTKFEEQKSVWTQLAACQSPAEAPPNIVLGLTVRDPRVLLPQKRYSMKESKPETNVASVPSLSEPPLPHLCDSPLWDEAVRLNTKENKMPESELNKLRSKHLVPGTAIDLGRRESRIPIVLVQRPGFRPPVLSRNMKQYKAGYGSGWDLIAPAGFGMAFHLAMVYRGARVGGLREARCIAAESEELIFPDDFPDTPAGAAEHKSQYEELKKKYERRPPAKRPNYTKLGISSPFCCPWQQLVYWWASKTTDSKGMQDQKAEDETSFYVMRSKKGLKLLNSLVLEQKPQKSSNFNKKSNLVSDLHKMINENKHALVPVTVTMLGRGVPQKFAHICIPSQEDLKNLQQDKTFAGPKESQQPDPALAAKKKEKALKKKTKSVVSTPSLSKASDDDSDDDTSESSQDQLPSQTCHRPVIGYISYGDFALGQGQGAGKGFCSVVGVHQLRSATLHNKHCVVLVRNTTSLQYRFAYLSLITS